MAWARRRKSGRYQGLYRDPSGAVTSAGSFARQSDALDEAKEQEDDEEAG